MLPGIVIKMTQNNIWLQVFHNLGVLYLKKLIWNQEGERWLQERHCEVRIKVDGLWNVGLGKEM